MKTPAQYLGWNSYSAPEIAAMLDGDHTNAWNQVIAWQVAYQAIDAHRKNLSRARSALAEAWPPEHSTAAVLFLAIVDNLDQALVETADAAFSNSVAQAGTLTALEHAKRSLDEICQSWPAANCSGSAQLSAAEGALVDSLNLDAHRVMFATDQAIFDNCRRLQEVMLYETPQRVDNTVSLSQSTNDHGGPFTADADSGGESKSGGPGKVARSHNVATSGDVQPVAYPSDPAGHPPAIIGSIGVGTSLRQARSPVFINPQNTAKLVPPKGTSESGLGQSPSRPTADSIASANVTGPSPASMLAPNMRTQQQRAGRSVRRRRLVESGQPSTGVPGVLVPKEFVAEYHDPGPGIIGLNR